MSLADLRAAADGLARAADRLAPDGVPLCEVARWWETVERLTRLVGSLKTLLAARYAESGTWQRAGFRSPAEQIAATGGTTAGQARELLEASRQVPSLPRTEAALRSGALSVPEAVVVASAAAANPDAEQTLLAVAERGSLAELRDQALRARAAADPDPDATHRRIHESRRLSWHTDAEGAWNLHARGTVDDGARVVATLQPIIDRLFVDARRCGRPEPRDAYAFDALLAATTARGERAGPRSEPNESTIPAETGRRASNPRFLALLRVDHSALARGATADGELCEIAGCGPVPVRVARDLLGESVLELVITRGVDVANVTHLGRGPTAAQRVALAWTSPTCEVEGCTNPRVEFHHTQPFAATHHTRLDELAPRCAHHHDLETHNAWTLARGEGRRPLVPLADPRHPAHPTASGSEDGGSEGGRSPPPP